jgi:hypothetical protein
VQERIFPATPVRVQAAADIFQRSAAPSVTGPPKHPRGLSQRDSGIDGTMRRPVAAVEARRSRSPNVADDVAVMEGWVGKEGGRIPGRYHPRKLMRVPICNYRAPIGGVGWTSRENTSSTQPSIKMCPVTLAKLRMREFLSRLPHAPRSHPARWLIQHAPNGLCV